jgi:hypothetical protein
VATRRSCVGLLVAGLVAGVAAPAAAAPARVLPPEGTVCEQTLQLGPAAAAAALGERRAW